MTLDDFVFGLACLRDTEARLKAFDALIERAFNPDAAMLKDWLDLRPGLYITLGAALGGLLKRDPLVSWGDTREHPE